MATKDQIGEISRQLAQTSPHSRRKPSCFLDLPRELRDKIYGLALKFQLPEKVYYARTGPVTAPTTALLRACKQVHAEASGILQKCNPLVRVVTDMDAFEWECTPDGYATLGLRGPSILNARGQSFTKHLGRSGLIVMDVVATGFLVESSRDHELLIALEEFGPFCRELSIYYATVAPNCLFSLTFNIHGDAKMYWTDHWQIQVTSAIT